MSLMPWLRAPGYNDAWPPMMMPSFGDPDVANMIRPMEGAMRGMMQRMQAPWPSNIESGLSEVQNDKEKFQVNLDVKHFKPEELKVKTADNCLTITGKHEERPDEHGYIRREFTRSYWLPKGVQPESMKSTLTPEGKLIVSAKKALQPAKEHHIPIQH